MKIVIVDDSKVMRSIVRRTLRQAGFTGLEIVEAADGQEGLTAIGDHQPELVLSDWNMPNMNGIEMLKQLRASGNQVKFGFVTSEGSQEMRDQASEAGAAFLIAKPFKPEDFEAAISG